MKRSTILRHSVKFAFAIFLFLASAPDMTAQDQPEQPAGKYPQVPVPNTELRSFWSEILGQEMYLYIKLPPSYYAKPQKTYLAWYITDANRSFPLVAGIADFIDAGKTVDPELLMIGIGYKIQDMSDFTAWRTRDLTPTSVFSIDSSQTRMLSDLSGRQIDVTTGGAATFLEVIEKEVIPFAEANYRISSVNRGLGGYSYGGLFTLYALFTKPELFSIYYAGSPSIGYDKGVLFTYENEYALTHKDLHARLFMTTGELEGAQMTANLNKMADLLKSHNYPGLTVETHVFPGENHASCVPSSVMRALRVLYNR
ncbi:MAG: alpha/beta hydrolase-fold protein [Bacteroidales bacterium]